MTGRITTHFKDKDGKQETAPALHKVVAVKKNGQWQMVSAHGNRIETKMNDAPEK